MAAADKLKSVGDIFKESLNLEAADSAPEFPTMESIENPIFLVEFVEFAVTLLCWAAAMAAAAATAAAAALLGKVTDIIWGGSAAKVILIPIIN